MVARTSVNAVDDSGGQVVEKDGDPSCKRDWFIEKQAVGRTSFEGAILQGMTGVTMDRFGKRSRSRKRPGQFRKAVRRCTEHPPATAILRSKRLEFQTLLHGDMRPEAIPGLHFVKDRARTLPTGDES